MPIQSKRDKYIEITTVVIRLCIGLFLLWLGLYQIVTSETLAKSLIGAVNSPSISLTALVLFSGLIQVIFSSLLILGLFTRISSIILVSQLFGSIFVTGFDVLGIRNLGLIFATLIIFFKGPDIWCIDQKFPNKNFPVTTNKSDYRINSVLTILAQPDEIKIDKY